MIGKSQWQNTHIHTCLCLNCKASITDIKQESMSTIKFRAGKVSYDVATKSATPEQVQGTITIKPSEEEDSFFAFEWKPKENVVNLEKEELLIVPGDATWTHVKECKSGRVFALEFLSSGARQLFWMQETNENDDDPSELSKKDIELQNKIQKLFAEDEEEEVQEESKDADVEVADAAPEKKAEDTPAAPLPVYDLNDFMENIDFNKLVDEAEDATLEKLYEYVPESLEKNRKNLLTVLHSGYLKRGAANLGEALSQGGSFIVSKSLGVDYEGEGIGSYLSATKKQAKKEEEEEKK